MVSDIDMYSSPQKLSDEEVGELRRDAGQWLKRLREAQGLSQRDLAEKVGIEYYTFISKLNPAGAVSRRTVITPGQRRSQSRPGSS